MIMCRNEKCIYNTDCKGCTYEDNKKGIALIIESNGKCDCFEDFHKLPEYQHIYYKAIQKNGKHYKLLARGAVTEINGFILYYEDKELMPQTYCTEKVSGVGGEYAMFADPNKTKTIKRSIKSLYFGCVVNLPFYSEMLLQSRGNINVL